MSLSLPASLLPADGRFGCGPSKVRPAQLQALVAAGHTVLGTSHRQAPVKNLVASIRSGLADLFSLPDGYEVVLGNGGTTAFWEVATACLVEQRSQHATFGEFSAKFAASTRLAPHLDQPVVISAEAGCVAHLRYEADASGGKSVGEASGGAPIDVYATVHNETSTGAMVDPVRITRPDGSPAGLMLVDATSGAGGLPVDISQSDVYYFSPQKSFGSDGGLWVAIASPAAIERAARIETATSAGHSSPADASDHADASSRAYPQRWIPEFLSFTTAVDNSRKDQTLNTPAVATLAMFASQVDWMLQGGGLPWAVGRSAANAAHVYQWAQSRPWASPFVADPAHRSTVVATIDLDAAIDAAAVVSTLRDNGILDVFPYRKLGRNQLRIGMFPAIDLADIQALTACVDYIIDHH